MFLVLVGNYNEVGGHGHERDKNGEGGKVSPHAQQTLVLIGSELN